MFRVALASYLIFATVAGPWLCCCSVARLSGHPADTPTRTPHPSSTHTCCCCHFATEEEQPQPEEQPAQPRSPEQCPCKESGSRTAPAFAPEATIELARHAVDGFLYLLPLATEGDVLLSAGAFAIAQGCLTTPFLTAEDLLRVFHILRC